MLTSAPVCCGGAAPDAVEANMIARLRGTLVVKHPPALLVEVGGIAYELEAPMSTFVDLPETGREVTLWTHFLVREDAQLLFGFLRESERSLFRTLLKVSGIGAKTALAMLSGCSVDEFTRLVETGDVAALTRLPGIGRKTAERLIVELRDRVGGLGGGGHGLGAVAAAPADPAAEAAIALQALGYRPQEVASMVKLAAAPGLPAEEIIRRALRSQLQRLP